MHKGKRADLCNLPKERRYKLNLYKWVLQESNLSMSFNIAHLGIPTALFSRAVIYYSNSTATVIPDSENKVFFVLVSLVTVPSLTIFRKIADTF